MLNAKGELGLTFREAESNGREVLFHAHCHQKALAAPARSVELLRQLQKGIEFARKVIVLRDGHRRGF